MTTAYNNAPASVRYPFGVDEYSRIGNAKGNWELGNGRYNDLDTVIISAVFSDVNIKSHIYEILNKGGGEGKLMKVSDEDILPGQGTGALEPE